MYSLLLENDGLILFKTYQFLKEETSISIHQLQNELGVAQQSIKTAFRNWRAEGSYLAYGIDFLVKSGKVSLYYTDLFSEREFFESFLKSSSRFQILYTLLNDPIISMKKIEEMIFLSSKTIRRRLLDLEPLLTTYGLKVGKTSANIFEGPELQKRLLAYHLDLLLVPSLLTGPAEKRYEVIERVANTRRNFGFSIDPDEVSEDRQLVQKEYFGYKLDEPGYLFVTKQLLKLEKIWYRDDYLSFIENVLQNDTTIFFKSEDAYLDLYNLHCSAMLFEGDLLVQLSPRKKFSGKAEKLNYLCQKHLPECQGLLDKHPELMEGYERIIRKYQQIGGPPREATIESERCLRARTKPMKEVRRFEEAALQYGA